MTAEAGRVSRDTQEHQEQLKSLVAQLSDSNGRRRRVARIALVRMGRDAVPVLISALQQDDRLLRWEAAKALSEIRDVSAIDALLLAMLDDDPEIRWLAAEGLAAIGRPAVAPLLHALMQLANRTVFRTGAHFVLRKIASRGVDGILQPVLEALEGVEPSIQVPIAAEETLIAIMEEDGSRSA